MFAHIVRTGVLLPHSGQWKPSSAVMASATVVVNDLLCQALVADFRRDSAQADIEVGVGLDKVGSISVDRHD